eukprot:gene17207-biopygen17317
MPKSHDSEQKSPAVSELQLPFVHFAYVHLKHGRRRLRTAQRQEAKVGGPPEIVARRIPRDSHHVHKDAERKICRLRPQSVLRQASPAGGGDWSGVVHDPGAGRSGGCSERPVPVPAPCPDRRLAQTGGGPPGARARRGGGDPRRGRVAA